MTAPTLPHTLTRLAELLPERFNVRQGSVFPEDYYYEAQWRSAFHVVFRTSPYTGSGRWSGWGAHGELILEHTLREEVIARGWYVEQWGPIEGNWGADILLPSAPDGIDRLRGTWRDPGAKSPAHALALALLAALEGDKSCPDR